jgi:hypothetical protein
MITPDSAALGERRVVLMIAKAVSYLVYAYLIVVEIILLLGFFLLLFGANPTAGFTEWVYRNLDRVMSPFRGIFSPIELGTTGNDVPAVFETSVVFAMIVYGIVALALSGLIQWLSRRLHQVEDAEAERERRDEYQARLDAIAAQQAALQADIRAAQAAEAARAQAGVSSPPDGAVPASQGPTGTSPGMQASPTQQL